MSSSTWRRSKDRLRALGLYPERYPREGGGGKRNPVGMDLHAGEKHPEWARCRGAHALPSHGSKCPQGSPSLCLDWNP